MPTTRVIKKYANRRLYDSTGSRHVTLEDIRKMIVGGEKVRIVDDKSGEDLTRAVLLQVIAEQEQFGTPVLSTELLEAIIRFYGNPVQEMLTRYMEHSVGALLRQQRSAPSAVIRWLFQHTISKPLLAYLPWLISRGLSHMHRACERDAERVITLGPLPLRKWRAIN